MTTNHLRTRPHGDARRRQILDAAVHLFGERGYNAVSLADIAKEVGISQAGLIHHFPTKRDLFMEVLHERERRTERGTAAAEREGRGYLEDFVVQMRENEEQPGLVRFFALLSAESLSEHHPGHEWFASHFAASVDVASGRLESILDSDKLPEGLTPRTVAQLLHGLADGLRLQWLYDPESVDRPDAVRLFANMLAPYMRA